MSDRDELSITTTTWNTGPWISSGRSKGDPPHPLPGEERAALSVVYGDSQRTVVVAFQDWDGCQALVSGQDLNPDQPE